VVGFLSAGGKSFSARLKNFNDFCAAAEDALFMIFRDHTVPSVGSNLGTREIKRLKSFENGSFQVMDGDNRVLFETIYRVITDIYNRDTDIALKDAVKVIKKEYHNYWLIKLMAPAGKKNS